MVARPLNLGLGGCNDGRKRASLSATLTSLANGRNVRFSHDLASVHLHCRFANFDLRGNPLVEATFKTSLITSRSRGAGSRSAPAARPGPYHSLAARSRSRPMRAFGRETNSFMMIADAGGRDGGSLLRALHPGRLVKLEIAERKYCWRLTSSFHVDTASWLTVAQNFR